MKQFILLLSAVFFLVGQLVAQPYFPDKLLQQNGLAAASLCYYAIDAKSGEIRYASEQKSLSPASVQKLMTTAAALDALGEDFTFSTTLSYSGNVDHNSGTLNGDLILRGGCDPAFYSTYFEDHYRDGFDSLIDMLKKKGIRHIAGKLVLDLSALQERTIPGGWAWDDIGNYYGTGVSALTYRDNLYTIHFSSPAEAGKPVSILQLEPACEQLKLENKVLSSERSGDHTIVYGSPGSHIQVVEGTIPRAQKDFVVKAAMPDPALTAGTFFFQQLNKRGIDLSGGAIISKVKCEVPQTVISAIVSPPLGKIIKPLNHESLNLFAEHLFREVGRKKSGQPGLTDGADGVINFIRDHKIFADGFYPVDGSGLSRGNALTARTLVETMKYIYDSPYKETFFQSLPIAGENGTLRNAYKGTALEKNMKAKTGSMSRIRSIAGIMTTKSHKEVLFAILINNFDSAVADIPGIMTSLLMTIYQQ